MAPNVLEGERVLSFDLETTGISTSSDRIVQIALVGAEANGTPVTMSESSIHVGPFRMERVMSTGFLMLMFAAKVTSQPL